MYYTFNPIWKDNRIYHPLDGWGDGQCEFIGDNSICYTHFASIEDGLEAARLDKTALRESNWRIYECSYCGLIKKRIMLKTLFKRGYFSYAFKSDRFGDYYLFIEDVPIKTSYAPTNYQSNHS